MKRAGFTLLEMLAAVAIIAVLAAILYPTVGGVIARSRSAACVANLRQLGAALGLYLAENNNRMPVLEAGRRSKSEQVPVIDNTLDKYLSGPRAFACPADHEDLAATTGTSYYWNPALNGQPVAALNFLTVENLSRIPVLSDKSPFHPSQDTKVNILFADGSASADNRFFVGE